MIRAASVALVAAVAWSALAPSSPASAQVLHRRPYGPEYGITAYYDTNGSAAGCADYECGGHCYDGHNGTDFGLPYGTEILAGAAGTVVAVMTGCPDTGYVCSPCGSLCGNHVRIQHADGSASMYCHMASAAMTVGVGSTVACGQVIGRSASSGCSSGPHLHFGYYNNSSWSSFDDPHRGPCGGPETRWVEQRGYRTPPGTSCACSPRTEECNGADDDCDGAVDDGLARACPCDSGVGGTETCGGGAWGACVCPNAAPEGYLDHVTCDGIDGWARDLDARDRSIDVHVYIGGPAGDPAGVGYPLHADRPRDDLCTALGRCEHAYAMPVPNGFRDGVERPVFAYAIDAMGGANPLLNGSPQPLRCDRPALPYAPRDGVLRHVPSEAVFTAWRFDWNDVVTLTDAELAAYTRGEPLPDAPRVISTEGDTGVYVVDGARRRHVPSPSVMDAWRFPWTEIESLDGASFAALEPGAPIADRPWLVRSTSGSEIFLLDASPLREELDGGVASQDGSVRDRDGSAADGSIHPDAGLGSSCAAGGRGGASPGLLLVLAAIGLARARRRRPRGTCRDLVAP